MHNSLNIYLRSRDRIRILVAAGGSGGHIFPALQVVSAISEKLKIPAGRLKIEFICSQKAIDQQIYNSAGYIFHQFAFRGIKGTGFSGITDFIKKMPKLVSDINQLFNSFKPDMVAGFGGFASVLPVLLANLRGLPSWIHESDQTAGIANKFLSLFADGVSTSFDEVKLPLGRKAIYTGHPIRSDINAFTLSDKNFTAKNILILGGSQASRALDMQVPEIISVLDKKVHVYHQARAENVQKVTELYSRAEVQSNVAPFFSDMLHVYNWADIIISRAGSGAVAELAALNKPVIFVPIPNVSGHQLQNARWLAKMDKALIVEEGDNFKIRLEDALMRLLDINVYFQTVNSSCKQLKPDSAETVAKQILDLIIQAGCR